MRVAIVANIRKDGIRVLIPRLLDALAPAGIEAVLHEDISLVCGGLEGAYRPERTLFEGVDIIVSFGGDGTILHTAHLSRGTGLPILGVNLGKVGFLAELSPDEIGDIPGRLLAGDYEIIERMAFAAVSNHGGEYFALNDVVLDRNIDTRILGLSVVVDGEPAGDFHADGLVVATPTGSTAHAMAAGGPLVMPECRVIVLTPICPHSLSMRPLIVSADKPVTVQITEGFARMAVDGQSFVDVPEGSGVTIRRASEPVRIARFTNKTYFDILHTRLRWGVSLKLRNA